MVKSNTVHKLFSIGHSTHSIEEFLGLLKFYGIQQVVDIRTIPRSRHNPQFNRDVLAKSLRNRKINYAYAKGLGGLRHAKKRSINSGWRNASFRGYADYMGTDSFAVAVDKLALKAKNKVTAIMCAEAVPWRCHRSLVADAFTQKQGWEVWHIISKTSRYKHTLTSFAKIKDGKIFYPEA